LDAAHAGGARLVTPLAWPASLAGPGFWVEGDTGSA